MRLTLDNHPPEKPSSTFAPAKDPLAAFDSEAPDAGPLGDVVGRGAGVAPLGEKPSTGLDEGVEGLPGALLHGALSRREDEGLGGALHVSSGPG